MDDSRHKETLTIGLTNALDELCLQIEALKKNGAVFGTGVLKLVFDYSVRYMEREKTRPTQGTLNIEIANWKNE